MRIRYYVIKRLILLFPYIIGLTIIVFLLKYAMEVKGMIPPFKLNPLYEYGIFLRDLFVGAWGYLPSNFPYFGGYPVIKALGMAFPISFELILFASIIAFAVAIPLGIRMGQKQNFVASTLGRTFAFVGYSIPVYFLALLFIILFSTGGSVFTVKGGLPMSGIAALPYPTPSYVSIIGTSPYLTIVTGPTGLPLIDAIIHGNWFLAYNVFLHLILPVLALAYGIAGGFMIYLRSATSENSSMSYMTYARSQGIPSKVLQQHHLARNSLAESLVFLGPLFALMLGGVLIVEYIFSLPGIGLIAVDSIVYKAPYGLLGSIFFFGIILILANFIIDIVNVWLDPRLR
ncbi:MAG: ABC transporter permease [Candidatus Thermoplasmatota archaeon]|nr:ABC transporter permease [Candidatus Thermoplasmatota archaeon]MCL5665451.1 ABC transporter permease [Candidatus Thermoplasmatota archaeon]